LDINPERMPVEKAVEINCMALNKMNERINALPVDKIIDSYFDPENNRGEIEMILVKSMK
jgi:xylose isomerase